jgi:nicotinamidase/pyrazinamidase
MVFWDVDTQKDFMDLNGALSLGKPASIIRPRLRYLTSAGKKYGITMFSTLDWHYLENEEISEHPDFKNTFPPHCMAFTGGARKIPETRASRYFYKKVIPELSDSRRILLGGYILKETFDVFNEIDFMQKIMNVLRSSGKIDIFVYGVATDFCVSAAVNGFANNDFNVWLVTDCIAGVSEEASKDVVCRLLEYDNVKNITSKSLVRSINVRTRKRRNK